VSTVALFFSILAIVANVTVVIVVAMAITGRAGRLRALIGSSALPGAFVVATMATLGSLYFSEIVHLEPCRLCWYQRIAMYPLVVILGIAAWRRDDRVFRYAAPIAAIGAAISVYHYLLEWFPWLDSGTCSATVPCTVVWFRELGFVSLPYLALSAFVLIITLVWLARPVAEGEDDG
jgi:disulfide bond formation protein DsbB